MRVHVGVLVFVLAATTACGGGGSGGSAPAEPLEIVFTEVHPRDGWIEIRNDGDSDAETAGARLDLVGDDTETIDVPIAVLRPGDRIVVDRPGGLPAPGFVLLRDASGEILDRLSWPGLPAGDVSYDRSAAGWHATDRPTRGAPETPAAPALLVNEVLPDASGGGAWVEVLNPGSEDLSLDGIGVTDDPGEPFLWSFPAGTVLEEEERFLLPLDRSPGGLVALYAPDGRLLDAVGVRALPPDVSLGRQKDGDSAWVEFSVATPGKSNKKGTLRALDDPAHREGAPDYDRIFDLSRVQTIEIEMDEAELRGLEDDLDRNAPLPYEERDFRYFDGRVRYGGDVWEHVGIRYKGNSSADPWLQGQAKISLKLDFDEFEDTWPETKNQRFWGLKKINLSNSFADPSMIREMLCLELMRAAGAPASRCSPWRVTVNGVYRGLYIAIEQVDKLFLADRFGNDEGNLYKPDGPGADLTRFVRGSFEKKTNEDDEDWSDVEELIRVLADPSSDVSEAIDVETFLRWLAVSAAVVNLDSYLAEPRNYYLYRDPDLGKFRFITWDHNLAFGRYLSSSRGIDADNVHLLDPDRPWLGRRPLIERVLAVPEWRTRYRTILDELVAGPFSEAVLDARARELHALIAPHVLGPDGERFPFTLLRDPLEFEENLTESVPATGSSRALGVLEFLARRRPALR